MKLFILTITMLTLISCGKDNESGTSNKGTIYSAYSVEQEAAIRQEFIKKGTELLRSYEFDMKNMLGQRPVALIRNKLKFERVHVTDRLIYDQDRRSTRSYHGDGTITLYIGKEEPSLDWGRARTWRSGQYTRNVMHELLLMGNVDDRNFVLTDRILSRR